MLYAADTMAENGRHDGDRLRHDGDRTETRRVPVIEAASLLGITPDAVRARLRRGTLPKEQGPDGETMVVVEAATVGDQSGDTTRQNADTTRQNADTTRHDADQSELVDALQYQIATLKGEVDAWREEARRKDHLLAAALERIPALEAPSEATGSPETASEEEGRGRPPDADTGRQERSWWRRFFGLE